jgi:hypothetical protein
VCRKRRWRFRQAVQRSSSPNPGTHPASTRHASREDPGRPRRLAYADPPYPGLAGYYPEQQEVDHQALIADLEAGYPDGWALSTSAAALRDVLAMCPASTRVCCWRRRTRPTSSRRALSAWEPLLVVGGRELETDVPQDLLDVLDYRGRYDAFPGALIGMKPPEFAVWMFRLLGARTGDELTDLYPGSGAIGRAWELYASPGPAEDLRDASQLDRDPRETRGVAIATTVPAGQDGRVPPVADRSVPAGRGETSHIAGTTVRVPQASSAVA